MPVVNEFSALMLAPFACTVIVCQLLQVLAMQKQNPKGYSDKMSRWEDLQ